MSIPSVEKSLHDLPPSTATATPPIPPAMNHERFHFRNRPPIAIGTEFRTPFPLLLRTMNYQPNRQLPPSTNTATVGGVSEYLEDDRILAT